MTFGVSASLITPMLCERLTTLSRLAARAYIAEPKLAGQWAPLYIHQHFPSETCRVQMPV
jgi:hypothetical protein